MDRLVLWSCKKECMQTAASALELAMSYNLLVCGSKQEGISSKAEVGVNE
jgi:hypothetical protein